MDDNDLVYRKMQESLGNTSVSLVLQLVLLPPFYRFRVFFRFESVSTRCGATEWRDPTAADATS